MQGRVGVVIAVGQPVEIGNDRSGNEGEGFLAGLCIERMEHAVIGADIDLGFPTSVGSLERGIIPGLAIQAIGYRCQILRTTHDHRSRVDDIADQ
ncbi:hypothetical protein D9M71_602010 [compost metagenome]